MWQGSSSKYGVVQLAVICNKLKFFIRQFTYTRTSIYAGSLLCWYRYIQLDELHQGRKSARDGLGTTNTYRAVNIAHLPPTDFQTAFLDNGEREGANVRTRSDVTGHVPNAAQLCCVVCALCCVRIM